MIWDVLRMTSSGLRSSEDKMEGGGTAYGAGKAGGPFDPFAYIKKPQVILRALSWLFSVIVFGCISSQEQDGKCMYNQDPNACGFGVAVGVIAFLGCLAFLVLDALFENISSIKQRKHVVLADIGFSGFWSFMWFVCFCYLTNAWARTNIELLPEARHGTSGVEAAIAFSFFSIASFAGLAVLAVLRFRQGASEAFASSYEPEGTVQPTPSPYSTYPSGDTGDPYQQPPFGNQENKLPPSDFNPPTY